MRCELETRLKQIQARLKVVTEETEEVSFIVHDQVQSPYTCNVGQHTNVSCLFLKSTLMDRRSVLDEINVSGIRYKTMKKTKP